MAWKKLTSYLVLLVCRFTLFLFISLLSWVLLGVPNVNTCFLTVFISCIIPLPPAAYLIRPIDYLLSKACLALRAYRVYTVVFTEVHWAIFIRLPRYVVRLVLYDWLDSILRYVINQIRFTIPDITSKVIMTASKASSTMFVQVLPWLRVLHNLAKMSFVGLSYFSRFMVRMATNLLVWTSCLFYRLAPLRIVLLLRKCASLMFVVGMALVCVPGLEPLPNLLATGHLYPGSLIRFQRCAKYEDSTSCHATFLEFSYSVWNLTRTGIFIIMCATANDHAWKPPGRDLPGIVERCLMLNNRAYSQLLLCAAGLPLLMNGHCFSQSIHNTLCIASLLLFMVILNGFHSRTALMTFHVLCCVVKNVQSVLVAVYNIYKNLQSQRNDYIVTLLYIMELYLMFLVIIDSSTRVISKVKNPGQDIMSQSG